MKPSAIPAPLETERLLLRQWQASDLIPFAKLNADPEVMEFFPSVMTADESDELAARLQRHFVDHGFGCWAVEEKNGESFIGFTGLLVPRFEAAFTPCVEIGWRLARSSWGRGYATEAATAVMEVAFDEIGLDEVISMTTVDNVRSRRVMEKIGMERDEKGDFDHPLVPAGHRVSRHVLYRMKSEK